MATSNVVRIPANVLAVAAVALGAVACASSSPPPQTAQTELTSAETTSVQFKLPAGYGDRNPPPIVATPIQKQMEEDQKYPMPLTETAAEWRERYPFPAKMLRDWKSDHPDSAARLIRWEDEQPDHVRMLVRWAVANPYEPLGSFMLSRNGWEDFRAMRDADPAAVDGFLTWCRVAPRAAEELIGRSEGFGAVIALKPLHR